MAYVYDQAAREALFSYSGEIQEQVHLQCIEGQGRCSNELAFIVSDA